MNQRILKITISLLIYSGFSFALPLNNSTCNQIAKLNNGNGLIRLDAPPNTFEMCHAQSYLQQSILNELNPLLANEPAINPPITLAQIKNTLQKFLSPTVIQRVLTTIKCADEFNINHNHMLVVIDYSLPSSRKRLWVFDLEAQKLLFNTYVSHGIRSGTLLSNYFSNKNNSKASSLGVYKTDEVYFGRHGLSLKLEGLEHGFNDNASNRSVVMHGGWYVDENFIQKYGRAGRSWGCPAIPENLTNAIINTIKDDSLFVVYYPSDNWLLKSKFMRCDAPLLTQSKANQNAELQLPKIENDLRDDILFADMRHNNRLNDNDPILVMRADNYSRLFHATAPLERMLRRQIDNAEYVALSSTEFKKMINPNDETHTGLNNIEFVVPEIKMIRGYYATEMKRLDLGKIKDVVPTSNIFNSTYLVHSDKNQTLSLKSTHQFIRWVGL